MTPLESLLRMRFASLRNKALNLKTDSFTKALIVVFGLTNVLGLGFWVSYESFKFVERFPAFGAALNAKMISLLFYTLLILVVLSTIIIAYTTIFLARETDFLFQHPIPPRTVLALKLSEAIAFSSWATLFLCFPVLVSFGLLRKAPLSYYFEAAAVLGVFVLFAGFTGAALAMAIAPIVRRLSGRQLLAAGGAILALLGWGFLRSFNFWQMDGENDLLVLDRFMSQLSTLSSPYFPGQWASSAVLAAAAGNHSEALFQGGTLLANTLIFLPLLSWYGARHYGSEWVAARSGRGGAAPKTATRPDGERAPARRRRPRTCSRTPLEALLLKDMIIFLRDPAQLSQSLLFVLLMVIYSLSLIRVPAFPGEFRTIVCFANLAAVCMILSSFTSRFIFPLVSLEGRSFWIVGLAPIPRAGLIRQKAVFGLAISATLGLATIIASNLSLRMPPQLFLGAVYATLLAGVCLTSLATGLGAAYPIFEEDNPARIAVGIGGTLNFFASALAIGFIVGFEALPYVAFGESPAPVWVYGAHLLALVFTVCVSALCFDVGSRSLARRDF